MVVATVAPAIKTLYKNEDNAEDIFLQDVMQESSPKIIAKMKRVTVGRR